MNKPHIIKDYFKLDLEIQEQQKLVYPKGFSQYPINFSNSKGEIATAIILETDAINYMIRMTGRVAKRIIDLDEDYDNNGIIRKEAYVCKSEKYSDIKYLAKKENYYIN